MNKIFAVLILMSICSTGYSAELNYHDFRSKIELLSSQLSPATSVEEAVAQIEKLASEEGIDLRKGAEKIFSKEEQVEINQYAATLIENKVKLQGLNLAGLSLQLSDGTKTANVGTAAGIFVWGGLLVYGAWLVVDHYHHQYLCYKMMSDKAVDREKFELLCKKYSAGQQKQYVENSQPASVPITAHSFPRSRL